MHDAPSLKSVARRLGLTLLCILLLVMAAHMLIDPAQYSAAGNYAELRGSGGGNAGSALRILLRHSVDAIGTAGTAAALSVCSLAGLALLWRPRAGSVQHA